MFLCLCDVQAKTLRMCNQKGVSFNTTGCNAQQWKQASNMDIPSCRETTNTNSYNLPGLQSQSIWTNQERYAIGCVIVCPYNRKHGFLLKGRLEKKSAGRFVTFTFTKNEHHRTLTKNEHHGTLINPLLLRLFQVMLSSIDAEGSSCPMI